MKGYAMLKIGEVGWIEKDRPKCGPTDAIIRLFSEFICILEFACSIFLDFHYLATFL